MTTTGTIYERIEALERRLERLEKSVSKLTKQRLAVLVTQGQKELNAR